MLLGQLFGNRSRGSTCELLRSTMEKDNVALGRHASQKSFCNIEFSSICCIQDVRMDRCCKRLCKLDEVVGLAGESWIP